VRRTLWGKVGAVVAVAAVAVGFRLGAPAAASADSVTAAGSPVSIACVQWGCGPKEA
jgi:hypothetical protein